MFRTKTQPTVEREQKCYLSSTNSLPKWYSITSKNLTLPKADRDVHCRTDEPIQPTAVPKVNS